MSTFINITETLLEVQFAAAEEKRVRNLGYYYGSSVNFTNATSIKVTMGTAGIAARDPIIQDIKLKAPQVEAIAKYKTAVQKNQRGQIDFIRCDGGKTLSGLLKGKTEKSKKRIVLM